MTRFFYAGTTTDQLVEDFDEIADGGVAMTAYAKLQSSDVPAEPARAYSQRFVEILRA